MTFDHMQAQIMTTSPFSTHFNVTSQNVDNPVRQKQFLMGSSHDVKEKKVDGRTILGSLNLNQNSGRVQPFRAAKQNATTEGFFTSQISALPSKPGAGPAFEIYDDSVPKSAGKQSKTASTCQPSIAATSELHPALTALPSIRISSKNNLASSCSIAQDSPMVLDNAEEERLNIFDIDVNAGIYGLSEYATEIFQHLREAETQHRAKPYYMRKQQDITTGMRSILIDWLVEVADEYKLHTETTHLAVNYIDRFLSQMAVLRGKLQLVGAAAMFLAAKFEEIYPPDVGEFVYITDDTYTKRQVLRMEHLILKVLHFDVAVPTSNQFMKRFLKAAKADQRTEFLAQYLCELALMEYDCIQYLPSMIAASAVCLASYTVSGKIWDDNMEYYMRYELNDLASCIRRLLELFENAPGHPQQALHEKYKDAKFDCVSTLRPPSHLPFECMDTEDS